jgi:hypothetical protein
MLNRLRQKAWVPCTLAILLVRAISVANAETSPAAPSFLAVGHFDDQLQTKHQIGGTFTVKASGANALVDLTLENGYRELVGTDGRDSFLYVPRTNSQAVISPGRFPSASHFSAQILWMVFTGDSMLSSNMATFGCPFYGIFRPEDVIVKIQTGTNPPYLPVLIRWYTPGYILAGTNRYPMLLYPEGYLMAEVSGTNDQIVEGVPVPGKVRFTTYTTHGPTNALQAIQMRDQHPFNPDDVFPIEVETFTIDHVERAERLTSYIPMIRDPSTRVNDTRGKSGFVRVASGEWWAVGSALAQQQQHSRHSRILSLALLCAAALFPLFAVLRRLGERRKA